MSEVSSKAGDNRQSKAYYVKVPCSLINLPRSELDFGPKWLLAHIYSFGTCGCWQSNETLAKFFDVSPRTISLWVGRLKKGRYILWIDPKGMQRTVWAKEHPEVKSAQTLVCRGNRVLKSVIAASNDNIGQLAQSVATPSATHCAPVAQSTTRGSRNLLPPTIRSNYRKKLQRKDWKPLSEQQCARERQRQKQGLFSDREGG